MSQPPPYTPSHSFVSDSATLPNFPGQALDIEFNNISAVTGAIEADLSLIQRDDGALENGVVTYDSLSAALQTNGIIGALPWATGTPYIVGSAVVQSNKLYRCLIAHTSGTFATDLAAGDWVFILGVGLSGPASSIAGHLPVFHDTTGVLLDDSGTPLASLAPLASPTFTGAPAAPTPAAQDNSTKLATTAYLDSKLAAVNGIATLDGSGNVPIAQIPISVNGQKGAITGVDIGTLNTQIANYTVQTTDAGKIVQAGTGSTGLFSITLPAVAGFNVNDVVTVKNGDAYPGGRGKRLIGFPSDLNTILWPLQTVQVRVVNGAWATMLNPGRWKSPSAVTLRCDTGGSDTNDGLSTSSTPGADALRHIATAAGILYQQVDCQSLMPFILPTPGQTFNEQVNLGGQLTGCNVMGIGSAAGVFNWTFTGVCLDVGDNAEAVVQGVNWSGNTANTAGIGHVYLHNNAIVDFVGTHTFAGAGANDTAIFLDGTGITSVAAGFTLSGTFGDVVHFDEGGKGSFSGTIAPSGSPTATRLFFLRFNAIAVISTAPTTVGYASVGPSLVTQNSVFRRNGVAIPGGIVAQSGGQISDSDTTGITASYGTTTNDSAVAGNVGEYISVNAPYNAQTPTTVTISIAAPAVITWTAHGLVNSAIDGNIGAPVYFATTGALPTGITAGTTYYVIGSSITTNTFQVATSVANALAGIAVTTTGTQSGTQTIILGLKTTVTTGTALDVAGIVLTAGDWDVWASIQAQPVSGQITLTESYISTVSQTRAQPLASGGYSFAQQPLTAGTGYSSPVGRRRISLAAPATVYLGFFGQFTVAINITGFLGARRVR